MALITSSMDATKIAGAIGAGVTGGAGLDVGTATTTALNLKAPIASPTFTGTVGGIPATNAANIGAGVLPAGVTGGSGLDAVAVGAANIGAGIFPADVWTIYDDNASRNHVTHRWSTRCTSASPGNTFTLLRYSRWWWGNGFNRILVREYRYGPNGILGDFVIHGHTRNGNPGIHTIRNDGVPTPYFTDYDGGRERTTMKLGGSAYREYVVEFESNGMTACTSDAQCGPNGGNSDSYYWHSQERIG